MHLSDREWRSGKDSLRLELWAALLGAALLVPLSSSRGNDLFPEEFPDDAPAEGETPPRPAAKAKTPGAKTSRSAKPRARKPVVIDETELEQARSGEGADDGKASAEPAPAVPAPSRAEKAAPAATDASKKATSPATRNGKMEKPAAGAPPASATAQAPAQPGAASS